MEAYDINSLIEFLRFPSVSADTQFKPHIEACADWLLQRFKRSGLDAEKFPSGGNSLVLARNVHKPPRKTVLIYRHYDLQPPDPLGLWQSPPFEPVIRDGRIFARGASDNKGQIFAHLVGVEKSLQSNNDLPVNVIFLVEGEEETGSLHFEDFLRKHIGALAADIVVISDTRMVTPGVPTLTYGLRGSLCLEVRLTGPTVDLHSGIFGGSVANPATVLAELLAKLHDKNRKVAVPGFYDRVRLPETWERERWATLPFNDLAWLKNTGAPALYGEKGFSNLERVWVRPTAEINGLGSGYQAEGSKTIVPSRATAKLSFRLVPDQNPTELREIITEFLIQNCPAAVAIEVIFQNQVKPYLVEPESPFGKAAQRALEKTFGRPVALIREGASIPITQSLKDVLHLDSLSVGLMLPDANAHSPNENFPVENFEAGIRLNQELTRRDCRTKMKTFFTLKIMPPAKQLNFAAVLFTGIPFFADSFGVFFANRDEPILFGFPFLLSYLIFWAGMTPVCLCSRIGALVDVFDHCLYDHRRDYPRFAEFWRLWCAQNQDDSAGAGGWKQIIRDDSNYLGSTVAGSLGGIFWTGACWPGVIAFATALLLVAIALPGF